MLGIFINLWSKQICTLQQTKNVCRMNVLATKCKEQEHNLLAASLQTEFIQTVHWFACYVLKCIQLNARAHTWPD